MSLAALNHIGRAVQQWLRQWWQLVHFAAIVLLLLLSPSSYKPNNRVALARHIYDSTAPILLGFTLMCALASLVLTRIVATTALSYGLSQYAVQVVIRVLVLELIPLSAALFVALRCTIPNGAELARLQTAGTLAPIRLQSVKALYLEVMPRAAAGVFSTIALAALSCLVALVAAYAVVYGFSLAGVAGYTRLFGQVFTPVVSLIFVLKTLLFSLAVSLIPMAAVFYGTPVEHSGNNRARSSVEMRGLVRMLTVIVLIEVLSLVGNYY